MGRGSSKIVMLDVLKEFAYVAKQNGFCTSGVKTTLSDCTSVYSYRAFSVPRFAGMIYTDMYRGNTVECGQESISKDLALRWHNQYYGGACAAWPFHRFARNEVEKLGRTFRETGYRFPSLVTSFLKQAMQHAPRDFPIRGPRLYRASRVEFDGARYGGHWEYRNRWQRVALFESADPFVCFKGVESIQLNGVVVQSHTYHGGLVVDKHFPFELGQT